MYMYTLLPEVFGAEVTRFIGCPKLTNDKQQKQQYY